MSKNVSMPWTTSKSADMIENREDSRFGRKTSNPSSF